MNKIFCLTLLVVLLVGCAAQTELVMATDTLQTAVELTADTVEIVARPTTRPTATPKPSPTARPTATSVPGPVCVPPSLMLHSKDRYKLTEEVIPWLIENDYVTITYADLLAQLEGDQRPNKKQVILSIDDINTEYINPYFYAMVEALHDNGMVAAIAINPKSTVVQNPANYKTLRLWASWGMEMVSHTATHAYLPTQGQKFDFEIGEAATRIYEGTGQYPVALVLPFGAITDGAGDIDYEIFDSATEYDHRFVVGIPGGRKVTLQDSAMFVGRVGTDYPVYNIANWRCD